MARTFAPKTHRPARPTTTRPLVPSAIGRQGRIWALSWLGYFSDKAPRLCYHLRHAGGLLAAAAPFPSR